MKRWGLLLVLVAALLSPTVAYAGSEPAVVSFEVSAAVYGDVPSSIETFTYFLEAQDEESPLPESVTLELKSGTTDYFEEITFDSPGVYNYLIYQLEGEDQDFSYDTTVYELVVYVVTDDEGVLSCMVQACVQGSEAKVEQLLFENSYVDSSENLSQTGDIDLFYYPAVCLIGSTALIVSMLAWRFGGVVIVKCLVGRGHLD